MKIRLKTMKHICIYLLLMLISNGCTGPDNKKPKAAPGQELPEKPDSIEQEPKDGTKVITDTTEDQ